MTAPSCARWLCPSDDPSSPFGPWPLWLFDTTRVVLVLLAALCVVMCLAAMRRCALRAQQARLAASMVLCAVLVGTELDHLGDHASWRLAAYAVAMLLLTGGLVVVHGPRGPVGDPDSAVTWYRRAVARAWRRRAYRRAHLLLIYAERGWARPHEMGLLYVCLVGGLLGVLTGGTETSGVVAATFPNGWSVTWYWGMVVGGVLSLAGSHLHTAWGLHLERAGLLALTGWLLCFPVVGLATVGSAAINVSLFVGVFGLCNLVRAFRISVDLHELEHIVARARRMAGDPAGLDGGDP